MWSTRFHPCPKFDNVARYFWLSHLARERLARDAAKYLTLHRTAPSQQRIIQSKMSGMPKLRNSHLYQSILSFGVSKKCVETRAAIILFLSLFILFFLLSFSPSPSFCLILSWRNLCCKLQNTNSWSGNTAEETTGDVGSVSESGRSPAGGNGKTLQYSCLGNPMDEEPGRLLSKKLQRVGHDRVTEHEHRYRIIKVPERTVFIDLVGQQQASGGRWNCVPLDQMMSEVVPSSEILWLYEHFIFLEIVV